MTRLNYTFLQSRYSEGKLLKSVLTTSQSTCVADAIRNGQKITKVISLLALTFLFTACKVDKDLDITYAEGLSHDTTSTSPFAVPLELDMYYPTDESTNRPVLMFIHGGGFKGGTKSKPEIEDVAKYYASRGWVFASIDYRTTEELCNSDKFPECVAKLREMSKEEKIAYYKGIAPEEWLDAAICSEDENPELETSNCAETIFQLQQNIAMYTAQRDAKAALRWIVANAGTYDIDTDYITVGGASAGASTALTLGVLDQEHFRDEISLNDDPTLSTTNLDETYEIQSMVYFWGTTIIPIFFEGIYGVEPYDANDPEIFIAHGNADTVTPYDESVELQNTYESLGVYSEFVTLEGKGHGAWEAKVDGKSLSELSFEFLVERQGLDLE